MLTNIINFLIRHKCADPGRISDGYHTFDELYDYRMAYNAAAFNAWAAAGTVPVYKSWKHHDGEPCFDGNWFVVVAILPTGQITNHYPAKFWSSFRIPEVERATHEYDGHTPREALMRLLRYLATAEETSGPRIEFL